MARSVRRISRVSVRIDPMPAGAFRRFWNISRFVIKMPRAAQPVTHEQVKTGVPDYFPEITSEPKPDDHGLLNGRAVIVDYGLPDQRIVRQWRPDYERIDGPAQVLRSD